jgi:ribosomal protein S18 acetylase RimI-like enzyme
MKTDSAPVKIRQRRDDDLDELVVVADRVHASDRYPIFLPDGDLKQFLNEPTPLAAWVAVRVGRLVGHVALNETTSRPVMQLVDTQHLTRPAIYVARLLVDPGSRRCGIGRQLLEHARRAAVDAQRAPFLDIVDKLTAAPAIALYRRDGWEEIGRVRFELAGGELDELVFRGRFE